MTIRIFRSLGWPLFAALAWGVSIAAWAGEDVSKVPDQGRYLAQVFFGLMVVLALIVLLGWLLRRVGQGTMGGGRHLRIVASLALGAREKIALVDIGGRQILVGVTPQSITHLQTFDEPVVDAPVADTPPEAFAEKLRNIMVANKDPS